MDKDSLPFWEVAAYELSSIAISVNSSAAEGEPRYLSGLVSLEMIKDSPFIGTGLGSFFEVYNTGGYCNPAILGVQRVHNDVLELFVETLAAWHSYFTWYHSNHVPLIVQIDSQVTVTNDFCLRCLLSRVTGSMLNAQVSFPYQLPVPSGNHAFLIGIDDKGSEDIESNTFSVSLKALV